MYKKLFTITSVVITVCSCSHDVVSDIDVIQQSSLQSTRNRTTYEALIEAANVIDINLARTSDLSISCITSDDLSIPKSRSQKSDLDTLAYIINSPDKGFALVAYNKYITPILAFSKSNNFTLDDKENNLAYNYFVTRLPKYIEAKANDTNFDQTTVLSQYVTPYVKFDSWHQTKPFSKYVEEAYPDCPVGCVALACVKGMVFSKNSLTFNNREYNFKEIRSVFETYYNINKPKYTDPSYNAWSDSHPDYKAAIDTIAHLLYDFGSSLKQTEYHPDGTLMNINRAHTKINTLGYKTNGGLLLENYNSETMMDYVRESNILILGGDSSNGGGHCWTIEGGIYSYIQNSPQNYPKYLTTQFYCDWGWNGFNNGFFNGEVFETSTGYNDIKYFVIINETIPKVPIEWMNNE